MWSGWSISLSFSTLQVCRLPMAALMGGTEGNVVPFTVNSHRWCAICSFNFTVWTVEGAGRTSIVFKAEGRAVGEMGEASDGTNRSRFAFSPAPAPLARS